MATVDRTFFFPPIGSQTFPFGALLYGFRKFCDPPPLIHVLSCLMVYLIYRTRILGVIRLKNLTFTENGKLILMCHYKFRLA